MRKKILIGGYQGADSIHTISMKRFNNEIRENFMVDFTMDITNNNEKASSLIEKTQKQEIHISYLLSSYFEKILPEIKILDLPYLFKNRNVPDERFLKEFLSWLQNTEKDFSDHLPIEMEIFEPIREIKNRHNCITMPFEATCKSVDLKEN